MVQVCFVIYQQLPHIQMCKKTTNENVVFHIRAWIRRSDWLLHTSTLYLSGGPKPRISWRHKRFTVYLWDSRPTFGRILWFPNRRHPVLSNIHSHNSNQWFKKKEDETRGVVVFIVHTHTYVASVGRCKQQQQATLSPGPCNLFHPNPPSNSKSTLLDSGILITKSPKRIQGD